MSCEKTTRRRWLQRAAAAPAFLTMLRCGSEPPRRPNILFCFADDQSWPHAGAYGDGVVETPAFDRVAREGVLFTRSYTACPSCTPSRSAVLTGRHIWQVEEGGVLYGQLSPKYPLVTHLLEDAGYHAGYTGKPWGPGNWQAGGLTRHPNGKEYNARKLEAPAGIDARDYAANFDDFLAERPEGQPFFFWFGSTEPHRVYGKGFGKQSGKNPNDVEVPSYWPDEEEIRNDILDYYFEIEWFDRHVGRMLVRLEELGELDNTIVVVTSDNGMPFPRAKVNLYEAGVHMPLAVRWGERVAGGRTVDDFVSHIDFAPTFLEAAGIGVPAEVTGRSLMPQLTATAQGIIDAARDHALTGFERHTMCRPDGATYPMRSIRTAEYLYIRNFEPERWPTGGAEFVSSNKTYHGDVDACPTKEFMTGPVNQRRFPRQYELCFGKRPEEELYRIADDPDQINNLGGDPAYAAAKQQLWSRLSDELQATGDPRMQGQDPWQGYVYHQTTGFGASFNRGLAQQERGEAEGRGSHKPE
ncbi:MAG: sulfatase [Bryobacterales bacterium]